MKLDLIHHQQRLIGLIVPRPCLHTNKNKQACETLPNMEQEYPSTHFTFGEKPYND